MRPIDTIMDAIKAYPEGIATNELTNVLYPDTPAWEYHGKRGVVYSKLKKLQKYGLVESVLVKDPSGGVGLRVWRARA